MSAKHGHSLDANTHIACINTRQYFINYKSSSFLVSSWRVRVRSGYAAGGYVLQLVIGKKNNRSNEVASQTLGFKVVE